MGYNLRVRRAGIYIHIPFCERKCTYCNFNTTDFFEPLARRYVGAVEMEIESWGRRLDEASSHLEFDTIYFGGGTPSIIEANLISKLIVACRAAFEVSDDAEVTLEINPSTLEPSRLEGWLRAGLNRASVGVQSFIDRELVSLSRTHTAADARRTIVALRRAGFDNISLDLIAGLPEQTLEDWKWNLSEALELHPEHLSLYLLELKEGTQMFSQIKRGHRPEPDADLAAEMYRYMCETTRRTGYEQYEISNFALIAESVRHSEPSGRDLSDDTATRTLDVGSLRSKHNLKYWTGDPFYGMGCGAHSYDGRARWMNTLKTESYIEQIRSGSRAVADRRELSAAERASDALFMGLRLSEGIDLERFRAEYEVDVLDRYAAKFPELLEAGLIELNEGRLALTDSGRVLSNEVFVHFV